MHEFGYCEGVLAAVEQRAAGRRVARVGVRVGAMHRVVPGAFEQCFQLVAAGGVAEGAGSDVVTVPMQASCPPCETQFESYESVPACPRCGSPVLDVEGGDELVLEWVQYHEEVEHHEAEGGDDHVSRDSG